MVTLMEDAHILFRPGHAGVNNMLRTLKKAYVLSHMKRDISNFVRKSDVCQRCKHSINPKVPMVITTTAYYSFDKIFLNLAQIPESPCKMDYRN